MENPDFPAFTVKCMSMLTLDHVVGLGIIAHSGALSGLAVIGMLLLSLYRFFRALSKSSRRGQRLRWTATDAYFLSLLVAELMQSVSAIISLRWALGGRSYCGGYCTVQGALEQIGQTGVALSTLALVFNVVAVICFDAKPSTPHVWVTVIIGIWGYLAIFVLATWSRYHTDAPIYSPTPYWCWISNGLLTQRVLGQFLWMWLAASLSLVLAVPVMLCARWKVTLSLHRRTRLIFMPYSASGMTCKRVQEVKKLIWYMLLYPLLVIPFSAARWATFNAMSAGKDASDIDYAPTVAFAVLLNYSGFFHVIVFWLKRPDLLLLGTSGGLKTDDACRPVDEEHAEREFLAGTAASVSSGSSIRHMSPRFDQNQTLYTGHSSEEGTMVGRLHDMQESSTEDYADFQKRLRSQLQSLGYRAPRMKTPHPAATPPNTANPLLMDRPFRLSSKPLPDVPSLPSITIPTPFRSPRSSHLSTKTTTTERRNSEGWWEMAEVGAAWLAMCPKDRTSPSLKGGLVRPDSVVLAPASLTSE